jgi:hypothetical protein
MLHSVRRAGAARALRTLLSDAATPHAAALSGAGDARDGSLSRLLRGALRAGTPVRALPCSCAAARCTRPRLSVTRCASSR